MNTEIWVAILSFFGTMVGSLAGIIAANKLVNYRLKQLEEEVRTHNNFARRMPVVEEQIKVINHRLEDLEHK